jgi:rhamnosyl/mannosyltransferase
MKGVDKKIIIAGGGPELGRMKTLAQRLKADNIIFLGPVNEAQKALLLDGCYGLVLPSHLRSEAFGLVLLEAAMRGKPLISTELGTGTSYANKHNETGLVVPPKDVRALQDALDFLSNNPGKVRQMGEAAKQRYDRLFTAELMCSRYAEIYKDVLTGCK